MLLEQSQCLILSFLLLCSSESIAQSNKVVVIPLGGGDVLVKRGFYRERLSDSINFSVEPYIIREMQC